MIVGGGKARDIDAVRRVAQAEGVEDAVEFVGAVSDPGPYYRRMNAFALPSEGEAFGLVYAEAGLHEVPAVGLNRGGAAEIIVDGVTGRLTPPRDPHALAQALLSLLEDPEGARDMGAAARRQMIERFERERFTHKLNELYSKLVR